MNDEFQPGIVAPSYDAPVSRQSPERDLFDTLVRSSLIRLEQFHMVRRNWNDCTEEIRRDTLSALAWLIGTDESWLYSFPTVCQVLHTDIDKARSALLKKVGMSIEEIATFLEEHNWDEVQEQESQG